MTEEMIKAHLAANLTALRKAKGWTQTELGELLTYSDKSISKWERGEGLPDIVVLEKLASLYGVTVDALIGAEPPLQQTPPRHKVSTVKRIIIPLLSAGLAFLVASLCYFLVSAFALPLPRPALLFLYAVPVACIPLIVFAKLWWGIPLRLFAVSLLVWSAALSLRLSFPLAQLNALFLVAGILQIMVILWYVMRYISKRKRSKGG